jgi:hypothetical protein
MDGWMQVERFKSKTTRLIVWVPVLAKARDFLFFIALRLLLGPI